MLFEKRGNIKETWAILNAVLGKQRKSVNYPTHLMQRDIHITRKEDMANEFNTCFTNVGPNLANDITEPDDNISIYDYLGVSIEQSLFMRPVGEEEVIDIQFNPLKSVVMYIYSRKLGAARPMMIGSDQLNFVSNYTYLGHIICDDLSDESDMKAKARQMYARSNNNNNNNNTTLFQTAMGP